MSSGGGDIAGIAGDALDTALKCSLTVCKGLRRLRHFFFILIAGVRGVGVGSWA